MRPLASSPIDRWTTRRGLLGLTTCVALALLSPSYRLTAAGSPRSADLSRLGHTATLLPNGDIAVVGGRTETGLGSTVVLPLEEALSVRSYPPVDRWNHTTTLLPDGRLAVIGGRSSGGISASTSLLTAKSEIVAATPLATAREEHSATLLIDGSIVVLGGRDSAGAALAGGEMWTPEAVAAADVRLVAPRWGHTATLL